MPKSTRISVTNFNRRFRINERFLKKIVRSVLCQLEAGPLDLEVVFFDNRRMRSLNRRYKGRDAATDVLSFGIGAPAGSRGLYVGEVCVSLDEALANSRRFESGFERELVLYLIHGIMHLFGYDDRKAGERARMVKRQEEILERLCGDLDLSRVLTRR